MISNCVVYVPDCPRATCSNRNWSRRLIRPVWACVSAHVSCSRASLLSAISGLLRSKVLHSGSSIIIYKKLFPLPNHWTSLLAVGRHMEAFVSLLTFSLFCLLQQTPLVPQCPAQWRCSGRDKRLWMCRRGHGQSVAMARSSINPGTKFSCSFALHICVLAGLLASHTLATDGRNHTAFRSVKKKKKSIAHLLMTSKSINNNSKERWC